jgi:hypothetical protein
MRARAAAIGRSALANSNPNTTGRTMTPSAMTIATSPASAAAITISRQATLDNLSNHSGGVHELIAAPGSHRSLHAPFRTSH